MTTVANCDAALIIESLKTAGIRLDGRFPQQFRELAFEVGSPPSGLFPDWCWCVQFSPDSASCLLSLGQTRILSTINAELGHPKQGRDNQGAINFKVGFDSNLLPEHGLLGNVKHQIVMLTRWLERLFFIGNALDREALCIIAGETVWNLHVDVRILDNDGNLSDACVLSVLGALSIHRRPEVTTEKSQDTNEPTLHQHSIQDREPLSLTLHHLPIPITFALFESGHLLAIDPDFKETITMTGCLTVVADPQGNILNIRKLYGTPLPSSKILDCTRFATQVVPQISKILQDALGAYESKRVQYRVVRSDDAMLKEEKSFQRNNETYVEKRQIIKF